MNCLNCDKPISSGQNYAIIKGIVDNTGGTKFNAEEFASWLCTECFDIIEDKEIKVVEVVEFPFKIFV